MIWDIIKVTVLCCGAVVAFVLFLFFLDGFIDVLNDPSACENQAKTFAELFRCP